MLSAAKQALRDAKRITVLTGAGISAESGVPTFRDALTGLWANYNAEDLATEEAFRRNPQFVWDWYKMRREIVERAIPNPGHLALAQLQRRCPRTVLITQNVDGLHVKGGSSDLLELHGNIHHVKCLEGCSIKRFPAAAVEKPRCPSCGAWLRPDVVWFGEMLPEETLRKATSASHTCDVFLCVGTSALVHPAASLPLEAIARGATLIEINASSTPLSTAAAFVLAGAAAKILPELLASEGPLGFGTSAEAAR
jgi:NAD-dependent deacetylase